MNVIRKGDHLRVFLVCLYVCLVGWLVIEHSKAEDARINKYARACVSVHTHTHTRNAMSSCHHYSMKKKKKKKTIKNNHRSNFMNISSLRDCLSRM